ncbi:MAG: sulfotransferase family protein [Rhizomicrobium sp.]
MTLRVIGAGCGRTGTASLKVALERLLGAPCYHMMEVFKHPEHVASWHRAMLGEEPDWNRLFEGYAAAVDWPAAACWPELMQAFPEALVLLSVRDPQAWWESANETIFQVVGHDPDMPQDWQAMAEAMIAERFRADPNDREACIKAFERNNAQVRASVPPERLLVWQSADGWEPICKALGVPVPDEAFPRTNTREDWRARKAARAPANGA